MAERTMVLRARVAGASEVRDLGTAASDTGRRFDATSDRTKRATASSKAHATATSLQVRALGALKVAFASIGLAAFLGFIGQATAAWGAQQEAVAQVEARLRSTGNVIGLTSNQIQDYASGLQVLTGVGDEVLLQQASVLLSFKGIAREAFPGALKGALNLSAGLKTDLNSSVLQLGKALDDPIRGLTALQRSGTIFTDSQKALIKSLVEAGQKAEAQQLILAELESQYGGAAEAARNTATGGMRALKGELGDLTEQIGRLIAVGTTPLIEDLIGLTRETTAWLATLEKVPGDVNEMGKAVSDAVFRHQEFSDWLNRSTLGLLEEEDALTQAELAIVRLSLARARAALGLEALGTATEDSTDAVLASTASALGLADALSMIERLEADKKIESLAASWDKLLGVSSPGEERLRVLARQHLANEEAAERHKDRIAEVRKELDKWHESLLGLKRAQDAFNESLMASIRMVPVSPFGELPPALDQQDLSPPQPGFTAGSMTVTRREIVFATDLLREGSIDAALAFGQNLARTLSEGGDVRDAFRSLIQDMAVAAGQAIGQHFGGDFGGAVGGALGGIVGELLSGLFQRGANEATATLEAVGGQLLATAGIIEGDLSPALDSMARSIQQSVAVILAEFGGALDAGRFGFKIREGEVVRVFYLGLVAEFENQADAASFLVAKIISEGVVSGLGASVAEAVAGGTFDSVEQLLAAMNIGESIDAALRSPVDQVFADIGSSARVLLAEAAQLGISLERTASAVAALTQAQLDQHAAVVLGAAGVSSAVGQWAELQTSIGVLMPASIAQLEADLTAAAESARGMAGTLGLADATFAAGEESFRSWIGAAGLGADETERFVGLWEEWTAAGMNANEIASAAARELENLSVELAGLPIDTLRRAATIFRGEFVGSIMNDLADLLRRTGQVEAANELEAKAEELLLRVKILSTRQTIQQAFAEGLLTAERVRQFNDLIRQIQQGLNAVIREGGFGSVGGGGGGGGRGPADDLRTQAQALEFWAAIMQEATDTINGISAAERQRMNIEAQLRADLDGNLITLGQFNEAMNAIAVVAEAGAERLTRAERRLNRIADKQSFLSIGRELADLAGDQDAVLRFERELARLRIEQLRLEIQLLFEAGTISEQRWQNFNRLADAALANLGGELKRALEVGLEPAVDLAGVMDLAGQGGPADVERGKIPPGFERFADGAQAGRDVLGGLLERLASWEQDLDRSLMSPLEASLDRARQKGEDYIAALEAAGATQLDIARAQMLLARELEQIAADAWSAALDPLRSLFEDLTGGPLSQATDVAQIESARARFQDIAARAQAGDVEAAAQLNASARELIQLAGATNDFRIIDRINAMVRDALGIVLEGPAPAAAFQAFVPDPSLSLDPGGTRPPVATRQSAVLVQTDREIQELRREMRESQAAIAAAILAGNQDRRDHHGDDVKLAAAQLEMARQRRRRARQTGNGVG